ncbi:MAG: long-chain fatty acid--CoA ligase [Acidobacteria bacterium]|nr:long-chain fatty acid--CoA ligase [Acidobacteriota bacterium]MBU4331167.1 long-chain fatty acid--CoA ligase [Acidobacteriota bacterium]MCG2814350.1 long-chain fatty acid--CoA ligase [Candidatus Aminicenantes bacterium]
MIETIGQVFLNTVKNYPKPDFMLHKKDGAYVPISTQEFADQVRYMSLGLREIGLAKGDKLVLLSENTPNWVMTDQATLCQGGITVPIYTSLVPEQIKYIIDDSDAKIVVCADADLWEKVETIRKDLTKVEHFITFQEVAPAGDLTLKELIAKGKAADDKEPQAFEKAVLSVKPDDVASIIYTSGTTGLPKGVLLKHSNFVSNLKTISEIVKFSDKDTVLSFLPLSHILERLVTFTYIYKGCTIAYAESLETLGENLLEVRPQIMVSVPRVFEKIYAKVIDNVLASSPLKRKIFFWAVKVGREYGSYKLEKKPVPRGLEIRRGLAHKLVYSKIIAKTGGQVRFFVSGGAALSKDIAEFFYSMGLVILEGYGLTETSPVISVNTFENIRFGTVGKPIPGVEVKIAEDGEIWSRGPHIMKSYYKKEAETAEVMENGWFKTGDIGHFDDDGFLVITDRKKDIIVTAGGKNVAPQPIENMIKTNPYIANVVVIGDRRKFISALIIPNFEKLEEYAKSSGIAYESIRDLIQKESIIRFLEAEVERATPNLANYEKVKKIIVLERDFEIEKGEMTPSLKIKRNIVEGQYEKDIDKLYQD